MRKLDVKSIKVDQKAIEEAMSKLQGSRKTLKQREMIILDEFGEDNNYGEYKDINKRLEK